MERKWWVVVVLGLWAVSGFGQGALPVGMLARERLAASLWITATAISPTGELLALASQRGVELRALPSLAAVRTLSHEEARALAFSSRGELLAAGTAAGDLVVWEVPEGRERFRLSVGEDLWALTSSPDGQYLAAGFSDGTIRIWEWSSEELVAEWVAHSGLVAAVRFSPDGRALVSGGGGDDQLLLWQAGSWEAQGSLSGPRGGVWGLSFHPDSEWLAAGDGYGTIHLWNWPGGEPQGQLLGHELSVWALVSHPEGLLISAGADHTVRIWNPSSGWELGTLIGHQGSVWALALSPSGQCLVSGSDLGELVSWDLEYLLRNRPRVLGVYYSPQVRVGQGQWITVQCEDLDRNISLVHIEVLEGQGWVKVEPRLSFNPRMGGKERGNFWFTVILTEARPATLQVVLADQAGMKSDPWEFELRPD